MSMAEDSRRRGLGRGLSALLGSAGRYVDGRIAAEGAAQPAD